MNNMNNNIKCCCKGCINRTLGCHASCNDYLKYKEEVSRLNAEKRKEFLLRSSQIDSVERMKKSKCTNDVGKCNRFI